MRLKKSGAVILTISKTAPIKGGIIITCSEYILSNLLDDDKEKLENIIANHERLNKSEISDGLYIFTQEFHMGFIQVNTSSLSGLTDECTEENGIFTRTLDIADSSLLLRMKVEERKKGKKRNVER